MNQFAMELFVWMKWLHPHNCHHELWLFDICYKLEYFMISSHTDLLPSKSISVFPSMTLWKGVVKRHWVGERLLLSDHSTSLHLSLNIGWICNNSALSRYPVPTSAHKCPLGWKKSIKGLRGPPHQPPICHMDALRTQRTSYLYFLRAQIAYIWDISCAQQWPLPSLMTSSLCGLTLRNHPISHILTLHWCTQQSGILLCQHICKWE